MAFYSGTSLLGKATSSPYSYTWSSVPVGSYSLTAVASDAQGLMATSAVVSISVAYTPPSISITSPATGSSVVAGSSVSFQVNVSDTSGTVTNVSYYAGSTLLGQSTVLALWLLLDSHTSGELFDHRASAG